MVAERRCLRHNLSPVGTTVISLGRKSQVLATDDTRAAKRRQEILPAGGIARLPPLRGSRGFPPASWDLRPRLITAAASRLSPRRSRVKFTRQSSGP